jgi:hypothetical protein
MHAVVRAYGGKGAKELFDLLEKRAADVESVMRSVKGFVSYTLVRSGEGGYSVTYARTRRASRRVPSRRGSGWPRMPARPGWAHLRPTKALSSST